MERSLVLVKPDGLVRGLTGAIINKFETAGLKLVAVKGVVPSKKLAEEHYPWDEAWAKSIWEKTGKAYKAKGVPFTETWEQIGKRVRGDLMKYIVDVPIIAMVFEGPDAVSVIRKLVGATSPHIADPSSIRGMYSSDSYDLADKKKRSVKNIVHASESVPIANKEIKVWFTEKEMLDYKRADEEAMFG